jgi:hypothetical protein
VGRIRYLGVLLYDADKIEQIASCKEEELVDKQAYSNSFEFKATKHGWSRDEYDQFNRTRAITAENMCKKYGPIDGIKRFDEYRERQRFTCGIEHFLEKYGPDIGRIRYEEFNRGRLRGAYSASKTRNRLKSNAEIQCYNVLSENVADVIELKHGVILPNLFVSLSFNEYDFGSIDKKILVEFYGDYWHANPLKYKNEWVHPVRKLTAKHIHHIDNMKRLNATRQGFRTFIIWELDWREKKEEIINEFRRFVTGVSC